MVSDNALLDTEHERKVMYYDVPEIREYVARLTGVDESAVTFSALALNLRGAMARSSWKNLIRICLGTGQCETLFVASIERGYELYVHSKRCTMRRGS